MIYLEKNFSVALMIDQRVTEGEPIEFFNKKAKTTTIPAQLVKKYGCDIVPVYIERKNKHYFKISFQKPIKFDHNSSVKEITFELNKILENMILRILINGFGLTTDGNDYYFFSFF